MKNIQIDSDIKGKIIAGYQAWFKAGDSLNEGWAHWSRGTAPSVSGCTVEIWPDMRDYPSEVVRPSGYPDLGNGQPSVLYTARTEQVIDIQVSWAAEYGVDCLALQRFYSDTVPERTENHYSVNHLKYLKNAAEKHDTLFYIMYDFSGAAPDNANIAERTLNDWIFHVEESGLLDSPCYATRNGKKVVCLWGLTGIDSWRYPSAPAALELIRRFKERDCFVIGGFPDNHWTEDESEYAEVYKAVDMVSAWTVGRFRPSGWVYRGKEDRPMIHHDGTKDVPEAETGGAEQWWSPVFERENAFCQQYDKEFLPVAFPGFAWSRFNPGSANDCPRNAGKFFWEQFSFLKKHGADTIYLAMFDEYDEGTAFIKAAEDSTMLPAGDEYFQTLAADGWWLSSDFYLRLAGAAGKVLRGDAELTDEPPIAHSNGPVYWRNGFESRAYVNRKTGKEGRCNVDICVRDGNWVKIDKEGGRGRSYEWALADTADAGFGTGNCCLKISGNTNFSFNIAPCKIKCNKPLVFTWKDKNGGTSALLTLEDGETLIMENGVTFSTDKMITAIGLSCEPCDTYIDDMELREAE